MGPAGPKIRASYSGHSGFWGGPRYGGGGWSRFPGEVKCLQSRPRGNGGPMPVPFPPAEEEKILPRSRLEIVTIVAIQLSVRPSERYLPVD